jgi:hypothetical protein
MGEGLRIKDRVRLLVNGKVNVNGPPSLLIRYAEQLWRVVKRG